MTSSPNGVQIFQGQTDSGSSVPFWISSPVEYRSAGSIPILGIYGTIGTCTITLEWRAPDGAWYDANEYALTPAKIGLYKLPINGEVPLRLNYTAGGGSVISAFVFDGQYKPNT